MKTFNEWVLENVDYDGFKSIEDLDFKISYDQLAELFPEYQSDLPPSDICGIIFDTVVFYKNTNNDNLDPIGFKIGYNTDKKGNIVKTNIILYSKDKKIDINPIKIPIETMDNLKTLTKKFIYDNFK